MALHRTPAEHDANPPSSWEVRKVADRRWHLTLSDGSVLDSYETRRAALEGKASGFLVDLYAKEGRWFAGETVYGWKPYAEVTR